MGFLFLGTNDDGGYGFFFLICYTILEVLCRLHVRKTKFRSKILEFLSMFSYVQRSVVLSPKFCMG
jgi:hypothetical protein